MMPNGNLHLSFFLERVPYFKELTHAINSDGGLGEEISRKLEADGVCRHQQVGIVLTPLAAENTAKFILETLENIKKAEADARAAKKGK